jgi:hypothetical protein
LQYTSTSFAVIYHTSFTISSYGKKGQNTQV